MPTDTPTEHARKVADEWITNRSITANVRHDAYDVDLAHLIDRERAEAAREALNTEGEWIPKKRHRQLVAEAAAQEREAIAQYVDACKVGPDAVRRAMVAWIRARGEGER